MSVRYTRVTPEVAKKIIDEHIKKGQVVKEHTYFGAKEKSVVICQGAFCLNPDSQRVVDTFKENLEMNNLKDKVELCFSGCLDMCGEGPIVIVYPDCIVYTKVRPDDVKLIVEKHLIENKPVEGLSILRNGNHRFVKIYGEIDKFYKQKRVVLRNCGLIDPENIDEYLVVRGYEALGKVLTSMTPQQVIEEVKKSGLRGRGGAGYPTGVKWELTAREVADEKFVICNADEGDPGAFMDRSTIEGDPHSIIEGMIIGGYAIGSNKGIIYIRAEYPLAVERLNIALEQAKKEGFLGENILGSGFSFDIEIRLGAGAFVCGEETALIHSIEGHRGMPRPRPPYPSVKGLFDKPTLINNVETWANIPAIIISGGEWFSNMGTQKSKGTKVFALAGKINNTGLIEVPMGVTLREIVYEIGGGMPENKKFKAVQTGGPSGGCLAEVHLDTPVDYESLTSAGSIMGSGGMIVIDEESCMVAVAKFFLEFTQDESCGKCTPCREGTKRMLEILTRIVEGKGQEGDIEKLERLGDMIKKASLCGLGQSAPNPVLSTIKNFREEYEEHIKNKKCRARFCTNLLTYEITDNCTGCTACKKVCPVEAISGSPKQKHLINQQICIKCGACWRVCRFNAISRS
ncbi:MAG: NADH-ubiquinone oxidoreductase-F iron-sulfur binding region domain-containing protein [Elusimicrobiota bacterium]|nr:NADH-ubiquinone oxidoreductase-F iron-sulfur binding region domain-containing protein [Elusimicrobiota bacterium]